MEWVCFWELTGLEKAGVMGAASIGMVLLVLGLILAFRSGLWKGPKFEVAYDKYSLRVPAPLACVVLGCALMSGAGWWLWRSFPANNLSFSAKHWTLSEVKERLERESRVRVELKGEASSFKIDKSFSGACASDVLTSICDFYPSELKCEGPKTGAFIIAMRP